MGDVRRILLADNTDIPEDAYRRADRLRREIVSAVERREDYVRAHGLDPKYCLPDGLWNPAAPNDFVDAYEFVRDGGYAELNRLRFRVPVFSGYHLMYLSLSHGHNWTSVDPIPADYDEWIVKRRPEPDKWVDVWRRFTSQIPKDLLFSPPRMLGEIGWEIDGTLVNHDTYVYQERINILHEFGVIRRLRSLGRPARVIEIGGGYGALAYALQHILHDPLYVICDLPESLLFSGLYLSLSGRDVRLVGPAAGRGLKLPRRGIVLLPNYMFHALVGHGARFDLAINTLSLSEMSELQIREYGKGLSRAIGSSGVFFEQNQDVRSIGHNYSKEILGDYFKAQQPLAPQLAACTEGRADLWANKEAALHRLTRDDAARGGRNIVGRWLRAMLQAPVSRS